jgi:hypothetical protein
MSEIEGILVATDLSAPASWAEARAGILAGSTGASIDLLHVVSSSALLALREALVGETVDADKLTASLRTEVAKAAGALESRHGVSVRRHVEPGNPPGASTTATRSARSRKRSTKPAPIGSFRASTGARPWSAGWWEASRRTWPAPPTATC